MWQIFVYCLNAIYTLFNVYCIVQNTSSWVRQTIRLLVLRILVEHSYIVTFNQIPRSLCIIRRKRRVVISVYTTRPYGVHPVRVLGICSMRYTTRLCYNSLKSASQWRCSSELFSFVMFYFHTPLSPSSWNRFDRILLRMIKYFARLD